MLWYSIPHYAKLQHIMYHTMICYAVIWYTIIWYGRFPKCHRVFVGPRPWHIEIRHRVKNTSTINLFGFETLKLKNRRLKLWKPTVHEACGGQSESMQCLEATRAHVIAYFRVSILHTTCQTHVYQEFKAVVFEDVVFDTNIFDKDVTINNNI